MAPDPSFWQRWKPSKKSLSAVLYGLRDGRAMTPAELAADLRMRKIAVCRALDRLLISGEVSMEGGRYRRA
ncbi:MAG TPA: hypothetical protein VHC90_09700 [Bryobacteraceae bacterium]|nr:hypothetical protein [Bryobacteraceae bacterium]